MEDKKIHPSLPSNYVTLAQLQERWLKEKERQQRDKEQQEQQEQKLQQQKLEEDRERQNKPKRPPWHAHRIHGDGIRSETGKRNAKQYQPKIKNDSDNNLPAVEAGCENRENLKYRAEGDQNAEQKRGSKSKKSKSKGRKGNRKSRPEKEATGIADGNTEATMERHKEVENINLIKGNEKEEIKSELNDKNDGLTEEVEETIGDLSINGGKGKENGRFWRPYDGFRGPPRNYSGGGRDGGYGPHHKGNGKEEIKSELNDKNDGLAEEVEEKIGGLSMNSGKGKKNGRFWRSDDGFRDPHRNSGGGGRYGGYGPHRGRGYEYQPRHHAARKHRDDKRVWVKKGGSSEGNVGVASGS